MQHFVAQDVFDLAIVVSENIYFPFSGVIDTVDGREAKVKLKFPAHLKPLSTRKRA
jgi:hypothetical protein